MRTANATLILLLLSVCALFILGAHVAAQDNHTPETAALLDQYNHINEFVNATDDDAQYWYWMDIDRGEELFVYFYGTGEPYHRCRMLYYIHGPDTYDGSVVHAEAWYRRKQTNNDYSDVWHWICPTGGRYYFHFYAVGQAIGDFHANVSLDRPVEIHRFAVDSGTLWWGGVTNLNKNDVWKIWLEAGPRDVEGVQVTVTWTYDHRVHLYAYDLVDTFEQNLLNISYAHSGDRKEVIRFTASYTGWYYIRVEYGSWSGAEDYSITTREYQAPNDGDNTPENATHVKKTSSIPGSMEASRDMHDWFTVDLIKGDLLGISMQIMDPNNPAYDPGAPNFFNFFEIQVYDPYMRRVSHGYDRNGGWPVPDTYINNLPMQPSDITMNGTYYIRASFSWSYGYYYDVANTSGHVIAFCDYVVQITIPNRVPVINRSALEEVIMLEDTTWWETLEGENVSSLDLKTVFIDPEDGVMTFSVTGDDNVTATLKGDAVSLRPRKDWHGEADIVLAVDDDGGNHASTLLHVIVIPVNDLPRIVLTSVDFTFLEDDPSEENRTIDLYDRFYDVDEEDARALVFSMDPVGGVTAEFEGSSGNVTFTAEEDLHGEFFLVFTATDTHGREATVEIKLLIEPVNDAPKARGGEAVYVFWEGFMLETFDAADHLYDPDGDTDLLWFLSYVDPADEDNLTVTNEGRENWNSDMVVTPTTGKHDWYGSVLLTIACVDGGGLRGEKQFLVTIINTPDAPEIASWTPRANPTFGEGEAFTFSVDSVKDPDGEGTVLHFSFWLKGPEDIVAKEVQNGTDPAFVMETNFEGEGEYVVTVVVLDEDLLSSVNPIDWVVTVTKTNRAPGVTIDSPEDGQTFKTDEWVEFKATADDPDIEDRGSLMVEWYEEEVLLGKGSTYSIRNLKEGTHIITVVATDAGGMSTQETLTIRIERAEEGPGFGTAAAIIALTVLTIVTGFQRGRGKRR